MRFHRPRILSELRRNLDARGVYIRRASHYEGFDPYLDLGKLLQPESGDVALDVGSNCGQTVLAIRKVFPTLPVHGFEPIAKALRQARTLCSELADVTLVQAAVGAESGQVTLYSSGTSQLASLRDTQPQPGRVANTVPLLTLDDYTSTHAIDSVLLLKTDTEGFDVAVLQGAQRLLSQRRVAAVLCEVGFSYEDGAHTQLIEVLPLMQERGLILAGLYDVAGFRHLRDWGCTYANALFVRRDLIGH